MRLAGPAGVLLLFFGLGFFALAAFLPANAADGTTPLLLAGAAFAAPGALLLFLAMRTGRKQDMRHRVVSRFYGSRIVVGLGASGARALVVALCVWIGVIPFAVVLPCGVVFLSGLVYAALAFRPACRACDRELSRAVFGVASSARPTLQSADPVAVARLLAAAHRGTDAQVMFGGSSSVPLELDWCAVCSKLARVRGASTSCWYLDGDAKTLIHAISTLVGLVFVLALPSVASAHFELQQPADALKTDGSGNPTGGSQKSSPCGTGANPSGAIKKVKAGGMLHLKVTEEVPHGGHYRVAVSPNTRDFVDPKTVVVGGDCKSAAIEAPNGVIVADGLFPHEPGAVESGKTWEADIPMPAQTCANCTLQVIQFMTPHSPGCFYYHCANIQIVDEDVPETPETTAGGGLTSEDGNTTPMQKPGGCNTTGSNAPSFTMLGLAAALVIARTIRARRGRASLRSGS